MPTFGRLPARSQDWIQRALTRCVTAGWVAFCGDEHPVVRLTEDGLAVMHGRRPARWLPPVELAPKSRKRGRGAPVPGAPAGSRPKAAYKSPGSAAANASSPPDEFDADDQALFDALRTARLELAQLQGVPAYIVAHDRTLRELVRLRPDSPEALAEVPGFGPLKVELVRPSETITLTRPQDGVTATLTRTGRPDALLPLARRETRDRLLDDLRRLDDDELYDNALQGLEKGRYT